MLITRVRYPNSANLKPVAEARLVLPTPPLPLNNRILIHRLYANSRLVITLVEGLPAGGKPCRGSTKCPPPASLLLSSDLACNRPATVEAALAKRPPVPAGTRRRDKRKKSNYGAQPEAACSTGFRSSAFVHDETNPALTPFKQVPVIFLNWIMD